MLFCISVLFLIFDRIQYQHSVKQKARWKLWDVWRKKTKQFSIVIGLQALFALASAAGWSVQWWNENTILFSQDVTAAVWCPSQDNETGATLLSQTNPVGVFLRLFLQTKV